MRHSRLKAVLCLCCLAVTIIICLEMQINKHQFPITALYRYTAYH